MASYLVSGLGRSQVDKNLWLVDKYQELYIHQTHSGKITTMYWEFLVFADTFSSTTRVR